MYFISDTNVLAFPIVLKDSCSQNLQHNQTGEILLPYRCTTSRSHSYVTLNNIRVLNIFPYEIYIGKSWVLKSFH